MPGPTFDMTNDWEEELAAATPEQRRRLDHLYSLTYEELRRLASTVRRGDRSQTLTTTALVNEAWVKLAAAPQFTATSAIHFKRIAARAMRQLLIEAARRRGAEKRGGGDVPVLSIQDADGCIASGAEELLALDGALRELAQLSPRQALLVEVRFFGGYEVAEAAELLGISETTALRDWRAARAWLALQLRRSQ